MRPVITADEARKITGGRTPHVPIEYEAAVKALEACLTLDEAKYWSDKADALAAWAKIYRSREISRRAKQLRLHAYRRMGELAAELRPVRRQRIQGKFATGMAPGPRTLLRELGLSKPQAAAARRLALKSPEEFREIVNSPSVPSIKRVLGTLQGATAGWQKFTDPGGVLHFAHFCRATDPASLAGQMTTDEAERARRVVTEIAEWLDEFEQHLPKEGKP